MSQWKLTSELLMFDAQEAFQKDPSVCETPCKLVMSFFGSHEPHYYGKQIEYPTKGNILCHWDSYKAHEAIIQSPFIPIIEAAFLKETAVTWDTSVTYHTIFSDEPIALDQPIREVTVLTLKAPENRQEVVEILTAISERTGKMFVFGVTHNDDQKYMGVCGWESLEAYQEAMSKAEVVSTLERLRTLADTNYNHLTQLSKVYRWT